MWHGPGQVSAAQGPGTDFDFEEIAGVSEIAEYPKKPRFLLALPSFSSASHVYQPSNSSGRLSIQDIPRYDLRRSNLKRNPKE